MTGPQPGAVAVAAHGLAGSRADLPPGPLDDLAWFDLVQTCVAGQLVGFLAGAIANGDLAVAAGQAEELAVLEAEHAGLSLLVERHALTVCSLLAAVGIEHRVVDGPGSTRPAYTRPGAGVRTFTGAELVVPAGRLEDARRLLEPPLRRHDGGAVVRRPDIRLRSTVLPASWAGPGVSVADLAPGVRHQVAGRALTGLNPDEQLVVACTELAVDRFSPLWLVRVRDVAQLSLSPGVDGGQVRRLAESWHVADVVAEMVTLVWQVFDLADKIELSVWAGRRDAARPEAAVPRHAAEVPAHNGARSGRSHRLLGLRPEPVPVVAPANAPSKRYR